MGAAMSYEPSSVGKRVARRPDVEGIAMCLVAKNAREHVRPCLESFAEHVHEIVVVDLASRDGTVAEIQKVCDERGWSQKLVLGRLKARSSIVEARNYAESLAGCMFVCAVDFEERVVGAQHLNANCYALSARGDIGTVRTANAFLVRVPRPRWPVDVSSTGHAHRRLPVCVGHGALDPRRDRAG